MGFCWAVLVGTPAGYAAALFYVLTYVLMAAGAFGIIIILSYGFRGRAHRRFQRFERTQLRLAFSMPLNADVDGGIPFLVGFYAKLAVLQAIVGEGLVGLGDLGGSVLGDRVFYLRWLNSCISTRCRIAPPSRLQSVRIPRSSSVPTACWLWRWVCILIQDGLVCWALGIGRTV
ncbi:MAG: proton-conducting transporter membrane subunit [Candidatus Competibacteraceae bacterium]